MLKPSCMVRLRHLKNNENGTNMDLMIVFYLLNTRWEQIPAQSPAPLSIKGQNKTLAQIMMSPFQIFLKSKSRTAFFLPSEESNQKHSGLNQHALIMHCSCTQKILKSEKLLGSSGRPSLQLSPLSRGELVPFEDALSGSARQAHYRAAGGGIAQLPAGKSVRGESSVLPSLYHGLFRTLY